MARNNKKLLTRIGILLIVVFLTAAITWQVAIARFTGDQVLLTKEQAARFSQYQKLEEIIGTINANYFKDVDEKDLIQGAFAGAVTGTGDKYSEYLTQDEMESIRRLEGGKFYGIGITYSIDKETGYPVVKGSISNSPAEAAGIQAGDILLTVDGEDIKGKDGQQLYSLISGDKGTKVKITIERDGEKRDFEIERAEVEEEVVFTKTIDGSIGYVRLTQFSGGSAEKVKDAFKSLENNGCTSFILDLRNNGGGLLSEAVDIADFFMPQGRIVYTKTKAGVEKTYDSDSSSFGKPTVVLVNGYSASASEVLAGAMQLSKVAKLVGETTYGKGVVQQLYPLTDGESWIKLTNSVYYLSNNETPDEVGIEPDEVVEMDVGKTFDQENDTQLKRAIALSK